MASSKRERELHRQKVARQQKEAAEAAERRRRTLTIVGAVVGVIAVIAVAVGIAVATGDDDTSTAGDVSASGSTSDPSASSSADGQVTCKPVNDKSPAAKSYKGPEGRLLDDATYKMTMDTNCGRIVFSMDQAAAPKTTRAIGFLANDGYFTNTQCHRLTTAGGNFVVQCGDPKGDGTGGPGFAFDEENLPKAGATGNAVYPRGTVAMANAGPGTTGSQFFIVHQDSTFPPNYTVLGEVTEGLDIIDYVAAQGTVDGGPDGRPKQPLQILKMESTATITQSPPAPSEAP